MGKIQSAKQLDVYQRAFELSMTIFHLTKRFPPEERYALVSQTRRPSRSVCLNLREAWAKRRYPSHFVSKPTDCDGENSETDTALDFCYECGHINHEEHHSLTQITGEIGRMLGAMMRQPEKFQPRTATATA